MTYNFGSEKRNRINIHSKISFGSCNRTVCPQQVKPIVDLEPLYVVVNLQRRFFYPPLYVYRGRENICVCVCVW